MQRKVQILVPQDPEGLPSPSVFSRAGAPTASWDDLLPLGAVPTKWLLFFVHRTVHVPNWLRGAAAMVLLRRSEIGDLEDDQSLDRMDRAFLPTTLERAMEIVESFELRSRTGKPLKTAWEGILEDFLRYQKRRRECGMDPLPIFAE